MKARSYVLGLMFVLLLSVCAYAGAAGIEGEALMCSANAVALNRSTYLHSDQGLKGPIPMFAIVNQEFKVRSVRSKDLCPIKYVSTSNIVKAFSDCIGYQTGLKKADYSFGRYTGPGIPTGAQIVAAGDHDSTRIVSNVRGVEYVSGAFAIDSLKVDDVKYWDSVLCEASTIYWQSAPSISLISKTDVADNTHPIDIRVAGNYDKSFSKVAVTGGSPTYSWHLSNVDYGTSESVTTTTPRLVYYPRYTGDHRISVTISDGTYSAGLSVGSVFYTGGSPPPCTPDSCRQIR